ncbi:hypothetical protein IPJ72_05665 [Candidatus Peregrinibacteria bacterium]|nr:MAG: hypothetical protein IPJ72_05665 [Candidatus Peregrinibacteria bacterium]
MNQSLLSILSPLYNADFFKNPTQEVIQTFERDGILVLENLLSKEALKTLETEADNLKPEAYRSRSEYNLYVLPPDPNFSPKSPRNRLFSTTKGCIADDQIPADSYLRVLYDSPLFREFLSKVLDLPKLYPYADKLSPININYYDEGDSLEWHFDNSDFAITLFIKACEQGVNMNTSPMFAMIATEMRIMNVLGR